MCESVDARALVSRCVTGGLEAVANLTAMQELNVNSNQLTGTRRVGCGGMLGPRRAYGVFWTCMSWLCLFGVVVFRLRCPRERAARLHGMLLRVGWLGDAAVRGCGCACACGESVRWRD